jgi:large subunit ribosomal protein LP2
LRAIQKIKWGTRQKRCVNQHYVFCLAEDQVAKLLKDAGVAADKENMKMMMDKLKGKKIHEMVADGRGKFASMPAGGAAAPVAAAAAVDTKAAPAKKEEKVEEDDNLEGGFDMFGDGY